MNFAFACLTLSVVALSAALSAAVVGPQIVTPGSWIDTLLPGTQGHGAYGYLKGAGVIVNVATTGEPAIVGASRTHDTPLPNVCCAQGLAGVAVNDNTAHPQTSWPVYGTGARITGTGAAQNEFNIANVSNDVVDVTPFIGPRDGPPGTAIVANLGCGGEPPQVGNTPNGKCSSFMTFGNNGSLSRKGLVVLSTALDTELGSGGNGVALEMATGQSVRWLKSDGTTLGEIWTDLAGFHIKAPSGTVINFP